MFCTISIRFAVFRVALMESVIIASRLQIFPIIRETVSKTISPNIIWSIIAQNQKKSHPQKRYNVSLRNMIRQLTVDSGQLRCRFATNLNHFRRKYHNCPLSKSPLSTAGASPTIYRPVSTKTGCILQCTLFGGGVIRFWRPSSRSCRR